MEEWIWILLIPMKKVKEVISGGLLMMAICLTFSTDATATDLVEASQQFLGSLDDDQRALASFEWKSEERKDWHFIPKTRKGLPLKDLAQDQQHLAYALLGQCMSKRGSLESLSIMSFEQILWENENKAPHRDSSMYHFSFFGKVSDNGHWGLSIEGHHLSLNFTISDGQIVSASPSFYGTNPDIILDGPRKGSQILDQEQLIAFELVDSLSIKQRQKAIPSGKVPRDILTSAQQSVESIDPKGLPIKEMNGKQKRMVQKLIREYVFRHDQKFAAKEWKDIQKDTSVTFTFVGTPKQFNPHYYRVQGKDFLIEYANTQNGANHAHAVYRRLGNDFGASALAQHLKSNH